MATLDAVTDSSLTVADDGVYELLGDATSRILKSVGCENVYRYEVPPIRSWQDFMDFLAVHEGLEQSKLEAWFIQQPGFEHDPVTRGTFTRYQQSHSVIVNGWMWDRTEVRSVVKIHQRVEQISWALEKNKSLLNNALTLFEEVNRVTTRFAYALLSEHHLHNSEISFNVLLSRVEASGRV